MGDPEAELATNLSGLANRALAASFVVAWQAAAQLREWAKPIAQTDYMAMRQAKEYIEKKLHELETEVLSRDEIDPETLVPQWDSKGTIVLKKASSKGALPANAEQLRLRLTVRANALLMIQLHHLSRAELKDTNQ